MFLTNKNTFIDNLQSNSRFFRTIKQLESANEESKRAAQETERLLQLVQMSQEEQNSKEKTIMDLQQYLYPYKNPIKLTTLINFLFQSSQECSS